MTTRRNEISLRVLVNISKYFFCYERFDLFRSHSDGGLFTCEDIILFSLMKISCFRAKAHLVFHWCLDNNINKQVRQKSIYGL